MKKTLITITRRGVFKAFTLGFTDIEYFKDTLYQIDYTYRLTFRSRKDFETLEHFKVKLHDFMPLKIFLERIKLDDESKQAFETYLDYIIQARFLPSQCWVKEMKGLYYGKI
jgi:hypothetical protein